MQALKQTPLSWHTTPQFSLTLSDCRLQYVSNYRWCSFKALREISEGRLLNILHFNSRWNMENFSVSMISVICSNILSDYVFFFFWVSKRGFKCSFPFCSSILSLLVVYLVFQILVFVKLGGFLLILIFFNYDFELRVQNYTFLPNFELEYDLLASVNEFMSSLFSSQVLFDKVLFSCQVVRKFSVCYDHHLEKGRIHVDVLLMQLKNLFSSLFCSCSSRLP